MIDNKLFEYYTSVRFVINAEDFTKVSSEKHTQLIYTARNDVKEGRKIRTKEDFKNESEYKLYLCSILNAAWEEKLNVQADIYVSD